MTDKKQVNIVLEDDFGRVQTKTTTDTPIPELMDIILDVLEITEEKRYQIIDNKIVDTKKQELLIFQETVVNRLNRQDIILRATKKQLEATIQALHEEIDNANGELKQALIRISNKELKIWKTYQTT